MNVPAKLTRVLPVNATSCVTVAVLLAILGQPVLAATFLLFDDFENDVAMFESWHHSPFVSEIPDVSLSGYLYYAPGATGRGLWFAEGFMVDAWAFLDYRVAPAGATVASGTVEFFLAGMGQIDLWGSDNGTNWNFIDSAPGGLQPAPFNLSIDAGDPVQFLSLRGVGQVMIDDLLIAVDYVPLPASVILLACGLSVLA